MPRTYYSFCIALFFFLTGITSSPYAARTYSKDWAVANIIAPLTQHSRFKYYLEPQLRLIDNRHLFNQFLFLGGVGYQLNPDLMVFIGSGWIHTKTPENRTFNEQRVWQQLNWRILNRSNLTLNSRTRMEERQRIDQSGTAYRLRQRTWLRLPKITWAGFFLSTYDELFFNLNHPDWTSPHTLEQNRAFAGLAKQLSKSAILDVGYLNQWIHSFTNQSDHVILLSLTMIT